MATFSEPVINHRMRRAPIDQRISERHAVTVLIHAGDCHVAISDLQHRVARHERRRVAIGPHAQVYQIEYGSAGKLFEPCGILLGGGGEIGFTSRGFDRAATERSREDSSAASARFRSLSPGGRSACRPEISRQSQGTSSARSSMIQGVLPPLTASKNRRAGDGRRPRSGCCWPPRSPDRETSSCMIEVQRMLDDTNPKRKRFFSPFDSVGGMLAA